MALQSDPNSSNRPPTTLPCSTPVEQQIELVVHDSAREQSETPSTPPPDIKISVAARMPDTNASAEAPAAPAPPPPPQSDPEPSIAALASNTSAVDRILHMDLLLARLSRDSRVPENAQRRVPRRRGA